MKLFTIGYEKRSIDDFVDLLVAHDVEVLADVRELPLSRKPGFSKTALGEAVGEAGIEYLHVRAVGNPKEIRKADAPVSEILARYEDYMADKWEDALKPLSDAVTSNRVCLVCYERSPEECHRTSVAHQLADRLKDLEVVALQ